MWFSALNMTHQLSWDLPPTFLHIPSPKPTCFEQNESWRHLALRGLWCRHFQSACTVRGVSDLQSRPAHVCLYTCIYHDGVRPDVIWCVTSQSIWRFQATPKSVLLFWAYFYLFGFLAAVLGVGKCFLQWISKAKVLLRVNGRDFG